MAAWGLTADETPRDLQLDIDQYEGSFPPLPEDPLLAKAERSAPQERRTVDKRVPAPPAAIAWAQVLSMVLTVLVAGGCVMMLVMFTDVVEQEPVAPPPEVPHYRGAAVSTKASVCAGLGEAVMKPSGSLPAGNAVDAAVASALCACVVHPHSSSLGGDGVMMVASRNATSGKYEHRVMDFRGSAPSTKTPSWYATRPLSLTTSTDASTLPTMVRGLHAAWGKWSSSASVGRQWKDVVEPVVALAEEGFAIDAELHKHLLANAAFITDTPALRNVFADENETIHGEGTTVKWPGMAATLRLVQNDPRNFHTSDAMRADYATVNLWEHVREADLTSYEPVLRTPIRVEYGGHTVHLPPPPASGGVLAVALHLLDLLNVEAHGTSENSRYHELAEAFKLAYQQDVLWGEVKLRSMDILAREAVSPAAAEALLDQFSPRKSITRDTNPTTNGTTAAPARVPATPAENAVSAIDHQRMAVSVVTGVGTWFGSGVMLPGTQVLLNNHMQSFSLTPNHPNLMDAGKRPFTSMTPLIVSDGGDPTAEVSFALSAQGGPPGVTALAQVLLGVLGEDRSIKEAIAEPRLHSETLPVENVELEGSLPAFVPAHLKSVGHDISIAQSALGSVRAVGATSRGVWNVQDPRD